MQTNHKNSITQLLKWGYRTLKEHNISNSLMEARWLLAFILKIDYESMMMNCNQLIAESISKKYTNIINDRALNKKPIQLIMGSATFYDREFNIINDVFIPRQDSEVIIDVLKKKVLNPF